MALFQTAAVTIQRSVNNSWITVATGIPVQLDNVSPVVASQMGGSSPFNSYELYSLGGTIPDIQQGDQLIDTAALDPKTGGNVTYEVMGNPAVYSNHLECLIEKIVGKVPA